MGSGEGMAMMNAIWRGWFGGFEEGLDIGGADPDIVVVVVVVVAGGLDGNGGFEGELGVLRFRIRAGMNLEKAFWFVGGGTGCGTPIGSAGIS